MLSGAAIESLIPHAGQMCLLDRVLNWDEQNIRCQSERHQRADHPLRRGGRLSGIHLLEYSAQAVALHAALNSDSGRTANGVLASVNEVELFERHIETISGPIEISATRILANDSGLMYRFSAQGAERLLLSGRLSIMLTGSED